MQQFTFNKRLSIKNLLPFSILLTVVSLVIAYSYANVTNWKYSIYPAVIFSFISTISPWLLNINNKYIIHKNYSKIYQHIVKAGISIVFAIITIIITLDIINGPTKYTGECLVKLTSGGGGPKIILTIKNDIIGINYSQFIDLSSEKINTKGRFYKCNSDVEVVYLKNLQLNLGLQKIK